MLHRTIQQLLSLFLFLALVVTVPAEPTPVSADFYVAPTGNDANPGTLEKPFATIIKARNAVRKKIAEGLKSNVLVILRGGTYELTQPLTFDIQDSGTAQYAITYAAYPEESPIISGGTRVTGWNQEDTGVWTVTIPAVTNGNWYFRELYVNDKRSVRARSPIASDKAPFYRITQSDLSQDLSTWTIALDKAQLANWKNMGDVEFVAEGDWSITRKRLLSVNTQSNTFKLAPPHYRNYYALHPRPGRCCYLENARAFLNTPGEWYLDRTTGVLSYWPLLGEDMLASTVVAPRLSTLMSVMGTATTPVLNLWFSGITFAYTASILPPQGWNGTCCGGGDKGSVDGSMAIYFEFASSSRIEDGQICHIGMSGLEFGRGCAENLFQGNVVHDIGGEGIRINSADAAKISQGNSIRNNHIFDCGYIYPAQGIALYYAAQTIVSHNLVHDMPYNGISLGVGSRQPTGCRGNVIEYNHIYRVMTLLHDGGAIYTHGLEPDTIIRGNLIHEVIPNQFTSGPPANGVFFDDFSKGYLVENNVIYKTTQDPMRFNNNSPDGHTIRNNYLGDYVFYKGKVGQYSRSFANDRFIDIPHSLALDPRLLTVEAWIRPLSFAAGKDPSYWLVSKNGDELTDGHYSLLMSHNNIGAYLNIGGGRENCYAAWSHDNSLKSNEWSHVAMTYDGTNLSVFWNGRLTGKTDVRRQTLDFKPQTIDSERETLDAGPQTQVSSLKSNVSSHFRSPGTGTLRIGKRVDGSTPSFSGLMDDVRIYNRALSAEVIAEQYAEVSRQSRVQRDAVLGNTEVRPALSEAIGQESALNSQPFTNSLQTQDSGPKTQDVVPVTQGVPPTPNSNLPSPDPSLQSSVSSLQSTSGLVLHLDFTAMHDQMEKIIAEAGPEEPYRTRFSDQRSAVSGQKAGDNSSQNLAPLQAGSAVSGQKTASSLKSGEDRSQKPEIKDQNTETGEAKKNAD